MLDNAFLALTEGHVGSLMLAYVTGGMEEWHVACMCGTRDDDGERMIACDGCGEWSHTRCAGYPDSLPSPDHFVCAHCSSASKSKL